MKQARAAGVGIVDGTRMLKSFVKHIANLLSDGSRCLSMSNLYRQYQFIAQQSQPQQTPSRPLHPTPQPHSAASVAPSRVPPWRIPAVPALRFFQSLYHQ